MELQESTHQIERKNTLSILGTLALVPALLIWGLWIYTFSSNPSASPEQKVEIFCGYLPRLLRSRSANSILVLLSSMGGVFLSALALMRASTPFKVLSIIVIVIGSLVTMLQLFSMM